MGISRTDTVTRRLIDVFSDTGAQPLLSEDSKLILAVNGEIYNFLALRTQVPDYKPKTHSDCEVILPLVGTLYRTQLSYLTIS